MKALVYIWPVVDDRAYTRVLNLDRLVYRLRGTTLETSWIVFTSLPALFAIVIAFVYKV